MGDTETLSLSETIQRACDIVTLAYDGMDGMTASDCFCGEGGYWSSENYTEKDYRNEGKALDRVEACVIAMQGIKDPSDFVRQAKEDRFRLEGLDK